MITLTDANDPFLKERKRVPEFVKNLMEEYNLTLDMFTEAYGDPGRDPVSYMCSMLYEYETFRAEVYQQFLAEEMAFYLNEAEAGADKTGFFNNVKSATAKIATGIANFFKRAYEMVRNKATTSKVDQIAKSLSAKDQRKFLKEVKIYTAEEINERNKIYAEKVKVLDGIQASLVSATDIATVESLSQQIDSVAADYDKRIQDFENRHAQRVKSGLTIADLNKAAVQRLKNPSEGNLNLYQSSSQKVTKALADFANKGAAEAAKSSGTATPPPATGEAKPQAGVPQMQNKEGETVNLTITQINALQKLVKNLSTDSAVILRNDQAQDSAIFSGASEAERVSPSAAPAQPQQTAQAPAPQPQA